jgi:hypothetical protein
MLLSILSNPPRRGRKGRKSRLPSLAELKRRYRALVAKYAKVAKERGAKAALPIAEQMGRIEHSVINRFGSLHALDNPHLRSGAWYPKRGSRSAKRFMRILSKARKYKTYRRRARSIAKRRMKRVVRHVRRVRRPARMRKGSLAAKRYMAKLRAMVGRKRGRRVAANPRRKHYRAKRILPGGAVEYFGPVHPYNVRQQAKKSLRRALKSGWSREEWGRLYPHYDQALRGVGKNPRRYRENQWSPWNTNPWHVASDVAYNPRRRRAA